ncbi:MAG: chemotaxis protein CheA [Pseudomonadota bacterium]
MINPADTFRQEATDLLENLEENLLELEAAPTDREKIDVVFRALHTIKGSGEMFGFSELAKFVHHLENAYELVRSGDSQVTQELIDISLASRDHIAALLDAGQDEEVIAGLVKSELHESLLSRIGVLSGKGDAATAAASESVEDTSDAAPMVEYRIFFKPEESALRNGMRPDLIASELSMLGECSSRLITDMVPPLEELDASACYLAWELTLRSDAGRDKIDDIFLFFDDGEIRIEETPLETDEPKPVQEAAAEAPKAAPDVPVAAQSDVAAAKQPETAAAPADRKAEKERRPEPVSKVESVRVQAYRLDELMDQLGELVIAQARLNRIAERLGDGALGSATEEIERLVTGMRDATLSIRMLPIAGVFGKFRRVVRDLATELGKDVSLTTEGGETELEKNIIDRLSDPLVHIIRNAVDHGIEDGETRVANGKTAQATVSMIARQSGGEVHIEVRDDGGGLKTDIIRKRALERGLIEPDVEYSDEAVHQLIFAPGFSTAATVSSVSGRGVGMDAVRNFIEDLRGAVEVKSETGRGTSVTLRLPLTLAIIDGLLVRIGPGDFVLPLASVEECVELNDEEIQNDKHRSIINIRNELVPYLNLSEIFGFERREDALNRVVIVNAEGKRIGLMVDDVIGQHQTVIKSLSNYHRNVEGLAGCTILGDGSVALIIDPSALIKSFSNQIREAA